MRACFLVVCPFPARGFCRHGARWWPGLAAAVLTFICGSWVSGEAVLKVDFESDDALAAWACRGNVAMALSAAEPASGSAALRVRVGGERGGFGWVRYELPEADYRDMDGIGLSCRAPEGVYGSLEVRLVRPREDATRTVYGATVADLAHSSGRWLETYVSLPDFRHILGPAVPPAAGTLGPPWFLLIAIQTAAADEVPVDVDDIVFAGTEEGRIRAERARRERRLALLRDEENITTVHPRIVLTPTFVAARLDRLNQLPTGAQTLARLVAAADDAARSSQIADPLAATRGWRAETTAAGDALTLGYASRLRRAAFPVELLAAAYRLTGRREYAAAAVPAAVALAQGVSVDDPVMAHPGRRMLKSFFWRSLALSYDWLHEHFSADQRRLIKERLVGYIELVDEERSTGGWGRRPLHRVWNWDPGIMSALGLAVLAVEGETRLPEEWLLFECRRHLVDYLTLGIDMDGCGHEGPNYFGYGMDSAVYVIETLRQRGHGDLFTETNFRLIPPWLAAETLPGGGRWNNLSDCGHAQRPEAVLLYTCGRLAQLARQHPERSGRRWPVNPCLGPRGYLYHFQEYPREPPVDDAALAAVMGWVWDAGPGRRPVADYAPRDALARALFFEPCPVLADPGRVLPLLCHFRGRGLVVAGTGFGADDVHLAVEAGPHAAGHDQSDKGTFTLRANGRDIAIDSGYGNDGNPRGSTSSFGHNVVLVDGAGQPMTSHNQSDGYVTGVGHSSLADWIRVDARAAWTMRRGRDGEPLTAGRMAAAERQLLMVRPGLGLPAYLVVYDDIVRDDRPHDYTWQWHIPMDLRFRTEGNRWHVETRRLAVPVLTTSREHAGGNALFRFSAATAGEYALYGLARAGGEEVGRSDSFFVTVDDGARLTWDIASGARLGWTRVSDRNDTSPRTFMLAAGEHTIRLEMRELQAEWATWVLVPADLPAPVAPDEVPDSGLVIDAAAISATVTPFLRRQLEGETGGQRAAVAVCVNPPGGNVAMDWFATTTEGSHPRLQYTVTHDDPRFLVFMLPLDGKTTPPEVERLSGPGFVGARLRWPAATDWIVFARGKAEAGPLELRGNAAFVRCAGRTPVSWGIMDGTVLRFAEEQLVESEAAVTTWAPPAH